MRVRASSLVKARDALPPDAVRELSRDLTDILTEDRGVLESPDALQKLGIDPAGTISFEAFEIDERAKAMLARLRGLGLSASDEDLSATYLDERSRASNAGWFMARARIGTKGGTLATNVERGLVRRSTGAVDIGAGEIAYTIGRAVWHVRQEPNALLVEVAISDRETKPRDVRDALAELGAWNATISAPLSAGEDLVVRLAPPVIASAGMLLESQRNGELTDSELDVTINRRLLAVMVRRARDLDTIDGPAGKPRYASVELHVKGLESSLTSTFAADTEAALPTDWADTGAELSVDGSIVAYSVNGPLVYRWKMLADDHNRNPYYAEDILRVAKDAGFPGALLLAGDSPFLFARLGLEEAEDVGHATLPFLRKWERLGVAVGREEGGKEKVVVVGILPADATEENAACALALQPKGCTPKERIRANATTKRGRYFVTRKLVEKHWVVLASRSEAYLKTVPIHVTVGSRPAFTGLMDPARMAAQLGINAFGALPVFHLSGSLGTDKHSFTFTLKP